MTFAENMFALSKQPIWRSRDRLFAFVFAKNHPQLNSTDLAALAKIALALNWPENKLRLVSQVNIAQLRQLIGHYQKAVAFGFEECTLHSNNWVVVPSFSLIMSQPDIKLKAWREIQTLKTPASSDY